MGVPCPRPQFHKGALPKNTNLRYKTTMLGFGLQEFLILTAIVVIFFSSKKIPTLLKGIGESKKEFKKGLKGIEDPRPSRDVEEIEKD